jgi:AraC-like DNA-binding protein
MGIDRLDALLQRFSVSAQMFHAGALCGINDFMTDENDCGQLHLIRSGSVEVRHGLRSHEFVQQPTLLFYPRSLRHRLITDRNAGADMACANVRFNAGAANPIARALPARIIMPLVKVEGAAPILDVLFREAFADSACGRGHIVNRLFEVVLILILRTLMNRGVVREGLLAGMTHPRLAKALVAMHEAPQNNWSLDELAATAGMSRSHFATVFRETVRTPPGDYLTAYRISVAQDRLRRGEPVKSIATAVGYGSTAAFSRAFTAVSGKSPRAWMAAFG